MIIKMKEQLAAIRQSASTAIAAADIPQALEALRVQYLGKKGELTAILKQMGGLSAEERPAIGALANEVREEIDALVRSRATQLAQGETAKRMAEESIDVTLPGNRPIQGELHPFSKVLNELKEIFLGMGFDVVTGPEVEYDKYNFEMLNMPRQGIPQ